MRGDLVLDDDSVVALDELCAQAGLAPLPLIEPMPDELDFRSRKPRREAGGQPRARNVPLVRYGRSNSPHSQKMPPGFERSWASASVP